MTVTEAQLLEAARALTGLREAAERDKTAYDTAFNAWKAEQTLIIEAKDKSKAALDEAETKLRDLMVTYHSETGAVKFHEAIEIRMTPKPEYDATFLKRWLMVEAPTQLALSLITLDTKAVEAWLKERADEQGAINPLEGAPAIPALVVKKPVAAILSKGLDKLPEPVKEPVPLVVPAAAVPAILTAPETAKFADSPIGESVADPHEGQPIPF